MVQYNTGGIISRNDFRRGKARLYYFKNWGLVSRSDNAMKEAFMGSFVELYNTRGRSNRDDFMR